MTSNLKLGKVFSTIGGNIFSGLWTIFSGWFLQNAVASSFVQASLRHTLKDIPVEQVMQPGFIRVSLWATIEQVVTEHVLRGDHEYFMVEEDGQIMGVATLTDIADINRDYWSATYVKDIMVDPEKLVMLAPEVSLLEALDVMEKRAIHQMPVLSNEKSMGLFLDSKLIFGILSKNHITHYLGRRAKLGLNAS